MERTTTKEKARFLDIARSAAAELRTQTYIGQEIGYIPKEVANHWINETKEIGAMLIGLERALKATRDQ
jgi:four helix bundle protein